MAGPYFTRNLTCSQAKAVEYADAVTRAGGATAAYAFNMFRFARGLHYPLTAAGQAWHCGVSTQDDKVLMTFGDVTYDGFTYNFDCLSTVRTRLGQEGVMGRRRAALPTDGQLHSAAAATSYLQTVVA